MLPNAQEAIRVAIRLTQHAETQVLRQRIDPAWVTTAITEPDWTAPDPDPVLMRSFKAIAGFGGRVLRVVYRPNGSDVLVVTVHFDRSARP